MNKIAIGITEISNSLSTFLLIEQN